MDDLLLSIGPTALAIALLTSAAKIGPISVNIKIKLTLMYKQNKSPRRS